MLTSTKAGSVSGITYAYFARQDCEVYTTKATTPSASAVFHTLELDSLKTRLPYDRLSFCLFTVNFRQPCLVMTFINITLSAKVLTSSFLHFSSTPLFVSLSEFSMHVCLRC